MSRSGLNFSWNVIEYCLEDDEEHSPLRCPCGPSLSRVFYGQTFGTP